MRTKILLLFAILFCIAFISNAQINANKYLIGGSFSIASAKNLQSSSSPDYKYKSLNANVQFGKAVKENTVVGVILSYGYSHNYYPDNQYDSKYNQYSAGIFYRKYKRLGGNFHFFGEADAVYLHSENKETHYPNGVNSGWKSTYNGASASFIPGISYAVSKRMQMELSMPNLINVSYLNVKTDYQNATTPSNNKGNIFSLNSNLNSNLLSNFGIGFKFLLGK